MIRELAHILTSPINQFIVVLAIAALLSWKNVISTTAFKISSIIALLWLYLCSQPFFSSMLLRPIENEYPPVTAQNKVWQNSSAIWVLACNHYNQPELPDVSRWNRCSLERLVHTYQMYRIKAMPIYLTGGMFSNDDSFSYASQAKDFLLRLGVPNEFIVPIDEGTNTEEELIALLNQKNIEEINKIAIVSSASHGRRIAKLMALNTKINFIFIPVEHLTAPHTEITLGWPSVKSLEKSQRAIYAQMANAELTLFY